MARECPEWDSNPGACFSIKSLEIFRAYFGCHNSLYIFATPRFQAIKLRNPLGFSNIKILLKGQLFETSGLLFDKWLFGPEKFSELSRNRPRASSMPVQCSSTSWTFKLSETAQKNWENVYTLINSFQSMKRSNVQIHEFHVLIWFL